MFAEAPSPLISSYNWCPTRSIFGGSDTRSSPLDICGSPDDVPAVPTYQRLQRRLLGSANLDYYRGSASVLGWYGSAVDDVCSDPDISVAPMTYSAAPVAYSTIIADCKRPRSLWQRRRLMRPSLCLTQPHLRRIPQQRWLCSRAHDLPLGEPDEHQLLRPSSYP